MSDVVNFDKTIQEMKNMAELQAYADAQFRTILKLNKELTELKNQIASRPSGILEFPNMGLAPEEEICIEQIHYLRNSSKTRELTLEEAKKAEIYTKMLLSIRGRQKDVESFSKKLSADELLALAEGAINEPTK